MRWRIEPFPHAMPGRIAAAEDGGTPVRPSRAQDRPMRRRIEPFLHATPGPRCCRRGRSLSKGSVFYPTVSPASSNARR